MKDVQTPKPLAVIAEALEKELQSNGMDYVLIAIRKLEDGNADLWSAANSGTVEMANMFAYVLARLQNDSQLAHALHLIATHPLIAARGIKHSEEVAAAKELQDLEAKTSKTEWVN